MASDILKVVIDERKRVENIDSDALLKMTETYVAGRSERGRIFKDYILSSDVFYIDPSLS